MVKGLPRAAAPAQRETTRIARSRCLSMVLLALSAARPAFPWGVGHDDSSQLAATISPAPFRSNPDLCLFAGYPDAMQDHAVGHDSDGYLRRLFTLEAIEALRAGDTPKALFFASAATHYLTDRACIAHAGAWYHRQGDRWTKYLPKRYQPVQVPHETKEVYYPHLKGTARDTVLNLPEPEYCAETWRRFQGSTNAYFDSLPSVRQFVTPELLRKPTGWTFTDCDQYARWYATFIALDMIDPQSLGDGRLRLRDPVGMKAVCVEELINAVAQDAAFYGYVAAAAKAVIEPTLDEVLPEYDKLLGLAEKDPVVLIPETASWPTHRAGHVLGMELLRAARRLATLRGLPEPKRTVGSYISRVAPGRLQEELKKRSAILLLSPADRRWLRAAKAPRVSAGQTGVIAARKAGQGNLHLLLRGATEQDTLYLVDYLLDLAWAPLQGRWPAEKVVSVLKEVWAGWKLILDLRRMSGQAAVGYANRLPYHHLASRAEDARKYADGLRRDLHQGASEEEWWQHFLLELPLPDGRRVPELIEKGTDYSALMEIVAVEPPRALAQRKRSGPPPVFKVARAATPVLVDGTITRKEWNGARPANAMVIEQGIEGEKVKPSSLAWLFYDDAHFLIAMDNAVDKSNPLQRGQTWGQDDALEIALRNLALGKDAPILVLRGFTNGHFESSNEAGAPPEAVERAAEGVQYKARAVNAGRWTAEWRIPFASLGVDPAKHTRFALNLSVRKTAGADWLMWVGTGGCTWEVENAGFAELAR